MGKYHIVCSYSYPRHRRDSNYLILSPSTHTHTRRWVGWGGEGGRVGRKKCFSCKTLPLQRFGNCKGSCPLYGRGLSITDWFSCPPIPLAAGCIMKNKRWCTPIPWEGELYSRCRRSFIGYEESICELQVRGETVDNTSWKGILISRNWGTFVGYSNYFFCNYSLICLISHNATFLLFTVHKENPVLFIINN